MIANFARTLDDLMAGRCWERGTVESCRIGIGRLDYNVDGMMLRLLCLHHRVEAVIKREEEYAGQLSLKRHPKLYRFPSELE